MVIPFHLSKHRREISGSHGGTKHTDEMWMTTDNWENCQREGEREKRRAGVLVDMSFKRLSDPDITSLPCQSNNSVLCCSENLTDVKTERLKSRPVPALRLLQGSSWYYSHLPWDPLFMTSKRLPATQVQGKNVNFFPQGAQQKYHCILSLVESLYHLELIKWTKEWMYWWVRLRSQAFFWSQEKHKISPSVWIVRKRSPGEEDDGNSLEEIRSWAFSTKQDSK